MNTRLLVLVLSASVAVGCTRHKAETREVAGVPIKEERKGLWSHARVQPDSAMRIAMKRVPGGRVTKGELEEEGGRLIYSFDLTVAGKSGLEEVHVDAATGQVLKVEHEE